jgi:hypothetical protein
VSLLLVLNNIFRLMVGLRSLPVESTTTSAPTTSDYADHFIYPWLPSFNIFKSAAPVQPSPNEPQSTHRVQFQFGDSSLSILGVFGATIHVVIIMYVRTAACACVCAQLVYGIITDRPVLRAAHRASTTAATSDEHDKDHSQLHDCRRAE